MATELLYHADPLLLDFEARVASHGSFGGQASVILDRTAFYPEAGGQMADRGTLDGCDLVDVQIDDQGVVHHFVGAAPLPEPGRSVTGKIDRARRRLFMSLHTAQHMFSRALIEVASAETVSARLGESACTIDLGLKEIEENKVAAAEALVNSVIDDDLPIRAFFPDARELERLPLRRKPKVEDHIRVVEIGSFDVSPCGGTHCTRTAQVGLLRVTGLERYKGMMRVSFSAGKRAREELATESGTLRHLAAELTCGPLDVPRAFDKIRRELGEKKEALRKVGGKAADGLCRELMAEEGPVVASLDLGDAELMRALAVRIAAAGRLAVLAIEDGEGLQMIAARPEGSQVDCGALVRRVAQQAGGKGGGRPERAEGRLPKATDFVAVARVALVA
jgi:alanyl-tRNA synthetase